MKLIILIVSLFSLNTFANECHSQRGAIDFGSGSTKFYAALVDTCERKIIKTIYERQIPLALNEAMEKSSDKTVPEQILKEALPKIKDSLQQMQSLKVEKTSAVATSVFRKAKNGSELAALLSKELQIPVKVISQDEEAELGYWSALSQAEKPEQQALIVWDIGGGSMQMFSLLGKKAHIFKGDLASVSFKNQVMTLLQFKDPKKETSPNPLNRQVSAALQLAKNHAYLNVPEYFKKAASQAHWVGIGGVLSRSVQDQVSKEAQEYSAEDIERTLQKRSLLDDSKISGDYKATDVTNLALVLGYMQALKLSKLHTVQASLGQGLVFKNLK